MEKKKILIVDNEPQTLGTASNILEGLGYSIKSARCGHDAIEFIEHEKFDLILTSDTLPDLDGIVVIQHARKVNPDAGTIVMTRSHQTEARTRHTSLTSDTTLFKPFNEQDIKAAVSQVLDKLDLAREALRLKTLMPLFEVSSALMSEVKLDRLFNLIIDVVKRETKADRVSLMLIDEPSQQLAIVAAVGLPAEITKTARVAMGQGIAGSVAQTGEALLINGPVRQAQEEERSITSALCVPLKVKGKVIGVLNSSIIGEGRSFTKSHLEIMTILAGQAAIAIENARLFEEVESKQATLEQLLTELLRAQEEERERISTEIHDSVAQLMVSASYHAQSSSALLAQSRFDQARNEIEHATKIISTCVKELRGIVTQLYPPALSELGLWGALHENVQYFQKEANIACHFVAAKNLPQRLSPAQEMVIYRVVQEALNNIRKHAQATEVQIRVETKPSEIIIEIQDNGRGFDVVEASESGLRSHKVGLLTMRSRAQMLGGKLTIDAHPGSGTRVILTIPQQNPHNLLGG